MADVEISEIVKNFGDTHVLKGVSLSIADGEFVSLVGPSGCGKSTLLRIIAGLESQTTGHVRIGSHEVDGVRATDRNLSMVFQSYALYPHLTVAENIAVPLRMRQLNALQRLPLVGGFMPGARTHGLSIQKAVDRAAATLEIGELLHRKPGQLSGGQQQRVALGRAIVRQPSAFLLDEPLSNLDAKLRVHTRTEIAELHRRLGATFVYVTHDQVEAMTMSDRIAVMMDGEILQCASPDEIYNEPCDLRVAEFIGSPKINILPTEVENGGRLGLLGKTLELTTPARGSGLKLAVRPEALTIAGRAAPIAGRIAHTENLGSEIFVQISVDGLDRRVIAKCPPSALPTLSLGEEIGLDFAAESALLFDANGKRVALNVAENRPIEMARAI